MSRLTTVLALSESSQKPTLSLRVSGALLERLKAAQALHSSTHGRSLSLSDTARAFLESATFDPLNHRLEATILMSSPTDSLLHIRRKREREWDPSRAEWILLTKYAEHGCRALGFDSAGPRRQSILQIAESFLAVYGCRRGESPELDCQYLRNLGRPEHGSRCRRFGSVPELVVAAAKEPIDTEGHDRRGAHATSLYIALCEEYLAGGVGQLNRVLRPYLPTLYGLAAQGHWSMEQRPVREPHNPWDRLATFPQQMKPLKRQSTALEAYVSAEGEPHLLIRRLKVDITWPVEPYPHIQEFVALLKADRAAMWRGAITSHLQMNDPSG